MKYWTIYCHQHIESGRRYIGLTSRTMERRWSQHIIQSKHLKGGRSHFANAIRKYGPESFIHEILAMSWDLESANATEETLIEQEGTRNPEKGFNVARGGQHIPHPIRKNPWNDPEFRAKYPKDQFKYFLTPTARAKQKAALNTPESKLKRSASSKKAANTPESKARRSASSKAALNTIESKLKRSAISKITLNTPESKAKRSKIFKTYYNDDNVRAKMSIISKAVLNTPESKAKRSAAVKKAFDTPESRAIRSAASKKAANTPEAIARRMTSSSIYRKICSKCGIEKDLKLFHKDEHGQFGVKKVCKECVKKRHQSIIVVIPLEGTMKICTGCLASKSMTEFSRTNRNKSGLRSRCLDCRRKEDKGYRSFYKRKRTSSRAAHIDNQMDGFDICL